MVSCSPRRIVDEYQPDEEANVTSTLRTNEAAQRVRNVCAMLGVPREDWGLFARWTDDLSDERTRDALYAYVDVMVAQRCWRPTDDLLSRLIADGVNGEELTADELRLVVGTLLTSKPHP